MFSFLTAAYLSQVGHHEGLDVKLPSNVGIPVLPIPISWAMSTLCSKSTWCIVLRSSNLSWSALQQLLAVAVVALGWIHSLSHRDVSSRSQAKDKRELTRWNVCWPWIERQSNKRHFVSSHRLHSLYDMTAIRGFLLQSWVRWLWVGWVRDCSINATWEIWTKFADSHTRATNPSISACKHHRRKPCTSWCCHAKAAIVAVAAVVRFSKKTCAERPKQHCDLAICCANGRGQQWGKALQQGEHVMFSEDTSQMRSWPWQSTSLSNVHASLSPKPST